MQYRHGDLLIQSASIPARAKPRSKKPHVLAEGETTGHAHVLATGGVVLTDESGATYLRITEEGAMVTHEEHGPITLPIGDYEVVRQREYDPFEQAARQVAD